VLETDDLDGFAEDYVNVVMFVGFAEKFHIFIVHGDLVIFENIFLQ
jgi:hypothetical protein